MNTSTTNSLYAVLQQQAHKHESSAPVEEKLLPVEFYELNDEAVEMFNEDNSLWDTQEGVTQMQDELRANGTPFVIDLN